MARFELQYLPNGVMMTRFELQYLPITTEWLDGQAKGDDALIRLALLTKLGK